MSADPGTAPRTSRRALAQQARRHALDLARAEGARVDEGVQYAAAALSAIRDRAHTLASESARVRALGLEFLPDHRYVAHCTERLRAELNTSRSRRAWLADVRAWAGEVEALLAAAVDLTSTIDIAGELDLPLDLVVAVQTGARDGLSALRRLYDDLDAVETGRLPLGTTAEATGAIDERSSRPAQWLVLVASMLLPAPSRVRYLEEFSGELRALAESDAGSRAQLAYGLRLISRAWSLRNALPPEARPWAGPERVRIPTRGDTAAGRAPAPASVGLRRFLGRWKARRDARTVTRLQVRQRRALRTSGRPDSPAHAYRRRSGGRSPIVVTRRVDAGRRRSRRHRRGRIVSWTG
jgi:hypothetical protein